MPFHYLREKPASTWSTGEELHFQCHQDKYSNCWKEKQNKQQTLAAFIAVFKNRIPSIEMELER